MELYLYANDRTKTHVLKKYVDSQRPGLKGDVVDDFDLTLAPPAELTNSIGMQLKLIPAGEFLMGSPAGEEGSSGDEGPQHRVQITKPFYLGVHEVTQAQYESVMGKNPSLFKGSDLPVEQVSWDEAKEFCQKLSARENRTYRLPTEAEWEYACRANTTTAYNFGNETSQLGGSAWFDGNSDRKTHSVGAKRPNAWGLYDMHGNVWEWCEDWYDGGYYAKSPSEDPTGPATGSYRVYRGGCWGGSASRCRSARRYGVVPGFRFNFLGFRVAAVPSSR
jgi:formylglycine-generating enzyme required for sulfatase activity